MSTRHPHFHFPSLAPLLFLPLLGCDSNEEIKVYQVPKEPGAVQVPATDPHAGVPMPGPAGADPHAGIPMPAPGSPDPHAGLPMAGAPGATAKPGVEGEVPASWKLGRASSMRLASYLIEGEDGALAEVSLIVLSGGAGGVLDNVNRWRAQIGLATVDEAGLAASSEKLATPVGEATVVDFQASAPAAEPTKDGRIVAAIVPLATETWFYKMRGNPDLIAGEKEGFLRWVATARKAERAPAPAAPNPHTTPPAETPPAETPPAATPPAAAPQAPREITWQVPEGWQEAPAKSMRVATFSVGDAGANAGEVSVVRLSGDGGGELANVNRWRGQIALPPITAEDLAASIVKVDSPAGPVSLVDCPGEASRTLAAWLVHDGSTWFFKLTGPGTVVEAEQAHFNAFLSSIDFPAQ